MPTTYLKRLYFDTIVYTHPQLQYLVEQYGADHILMGTDYPADMGEIDPIGFVEGAPGLDDAERRAILGGNAARLLNIEMNAARLENGGGRTMLFTCRPPGTPIPGHFPGPAHPRGKWFTIDIHCHVRSDKAARDGRGQRGGVALVSRNRRPARKARRSQPRQRRAHRTSRAIRPSSASPTWI